MDSFDCSLEDELELLAGSDEFRGIFSGDVTKSLSQSATDPLAGNGENNSSANINEGLLRGGGENHGSLSANTDEDSLFGDQDSLFGDDDGSLFGDDEGLASPHEAITPTTTRPEGPAVAPVAHAPAQLAFPKPAAPWNVPTVPSASFFPPPFVSAAPAGAYGPVTAATPATPSVPSPALSFVASPVATPDAPSVVTPRATSFVAAPVGAYDPTPVTAAPASPDEEETHPAQIADSDNYNDAGVIRVGQIPGFRYSDAATQQRFRLLSTIDAIEADGNDIGEYLAPFLTLKKETRFDKDISPALEIDEGTRKKVLTPAIKQWLAESEHSRLLDAPASPERLDTKVSLIAASVGILRSNDWGTTWFGGETRKLAWPRDSTVICFHFARLLYLTLRSHRSGARNKTTKSPEALPAAPGPAPAQAAAPAAVQAAASAPARAQVATSASAQVTAPDRLGGPSNPIDVDAVSRPAAHASSEDITPEQPRVAPPAPPKKKRERPDWSKCSTDHHVNGGFGLGKRARQG